MKVYLSLCLGSIVLFLQACTAYYLQNKSSRGQFIQISYEKCINPAERRSALNRYEKKRKITNVTQTTNDSTCLFEFTIQPQTVLSLGSILNLYSEVKAPEEKRVLCFNKYEKDAPSSLCDTIINKYGRNTGINKFKLTNKAISWMGRSTYVYRIEN